MKCPKCGKKMIKREIFVTVDAMIKGYNYMEDELIEKDDKFGKYLPELACDDCNIIFCTAGAII